MSQNGFSLLELLLATTLTIIIGMIGLQIFQQNEHTFETQNNLSEVQQNARAVIFQINDDIRRTGEGVPAYAQSFETTTSEPMAAVLVGSDSSHLVLREDYSNVQADVLSTPVDYTLNTTQAISISDTTSFYNELGTATPTGQFAYIWGTGLNSCWGWIRALISNVSNAAGTISLLPQQISQGCHTAINTIHFTTKSTIALEQAVMIYLSSGSIWRKTAADMTLQTSPIWNAASEIGRDFDGLTFTYYDGNDNTVNPTTLAARLSIARIDTSIHTSSGLGLAMRGYPVNLRIR